MELHEDVGIFSHVEGHEIFIFLQDLDQKLNEVVELGIADVYFEGVEVVDESGLGSSSEGVVLVADPAIFLVLFLEDFSGQDYYFFEEVEQPFGTCSHDHLQTVNQLQHLRLAAIDVVFQTFGQEHLDDQCCFLDAAALGVAFHLEYLIEFVYFCLEDVERFAYELNVT